MSEPRMGNPQAGAHDDELETCPACHGNGLVTADEAWKDEDDKPLPEDKGRAPSSERPLMSEQTKSPLHVFRNDVIEWVIATSPEDADAVLLETYGPGWEPPQDGNEWVALKDDGQIWITDDDGRKVVKTCAAWVAEKGRGFLATTEY